jgi:hypothetical protein
VTYAKAPSAKLDRRYGGLVNGVVNSPIWNGNEIFFNSDGSLHVLGIKTESALDWTNPRTLFDVQGLAAPGQGTTNYDVTHDGKQILLVVPQTEPGTEAMQEIHIVLNWYEELKRLVPAR